VVSVIKQNVTETTQESVKNKTIRRNSRKVCMIIPNANSLIQQETKIQNHEKHVIEKVDNIVVGLT